MDERDQIQRCIDGDEEAFAPLVLKYKTKVFNLAYSMTRNRETADDLAQEIFIKAFLALKKFQFRSEFGTWLYRISVNHIRDHLRAQGKVKLVPFEDNLREAGVEADQLSRREEEQNAAHRRRLVFEGVQAMPEKYRVILTLRDIQGLTYEEMTRILQVSPGTVDSRLHRARKMLRKKIMSLSLQKGEPR